jgi:cell division transport system permease protein
MIEGFNQILFTPFKNFFIILLLTFTLFLPVGLYILVQNIDSLSNKWNQSSEIVLYLKPNVNINMAQDLALQLKADHTAIMDVKVISAKEGIQDFAQIAGFDEILAGFKVNPLPQVIIVYPRLSQVSEARIESLIKDLQALREVEELKVDLAWIKHSYKLLAFWHKLAEILIIMFGVGALITVGFMAYVTPRVSSASKRVLHYQCFWQGLISALLAIAATKIILMQLNDLGFAWQGLSQNDSIMFILAVMVLNIISLRFSISYLGIEQKT